MVTNVHLFRFCPVRIVFLTIKRHVKLSPGQKPKRVKTETEKKSLEMSISSLKLSHVSVEEKITFIKFYHSRERENTTEFCSVAIHAPFSMHT